MTRYKETPLDDTVEIETSSSTSKTGRQPTQSLQWWHGWAPLFIFPGSVLLFAPQDWPRWAVMWLLAVAIFVGCKWLTWRRADIRGAPLWRHLGYLMAWPGLDAPGFITSKRASAPAKPARSEWLFAFAKVAVGIAILFGLTRYVPAEYPYLVVWVGMVGIAFILHFGVFHLLSCAWRAIGVMARPLMNWPLRATSLSEFWGQRWNTAFRDLTHRFLFRPLSKRLGPGGAIFTGFVFSGLVHDLVISVPAGGGYGGPTLFFLLHGAGMLIERSRAGRALGLGTGWQGRIFTLVMLIAPALLLFHWPFVTEVVMPFLEVLRAV
jgi:hypothetical protein